MKITFLGATEEVTGSKYLIEHKDIKILVDCGLFQGEQEFTARNWEPFPVDPKGINALVLTHAHIDHTGYIPLLVKQGFQGKIYCSKATYALCSLLLIDSANLFEENAKRYNEDKSLPYKPPLYTKVDVEHSLRFFKVVEYDTIFTLGAILKIKLISSRHIIGASFVLISNGKKTLTFSGDLGRPHSLIMKSPPHLKETDFLVLESTYGNRLHEHGDPIKSLAALIDEAVAKRGVLIIPVFAVSRAQEILYCLYQLKQSISHIPIFLDSPLAIDVTHLFCNYKDEYVLSPQICHEAFKIATYTYTVEESKHINHVQPPMIIIAGGGMADGGRVLYHFEHYISDARNIIAFVGYQARGTHGRALSDGAQEIEIYGRRYPVRAKITMINNFSAHADYHEILEWLSSFESRPQTVFLTHGELESALFLKENIQKRFGWTVIIPHYLESFDLT